VDPHLRAEHEAPERTTPQGTQAHGVEHGHEGQDVIYRPIFLWFGGMALFMGLTLILLGVTQGFWTMGAEREDALPSPLFGQQRTPPAPRILPNPWDIPGENPMERVQRYPETLPDEREREVEAAAKIGLLDAKTGQPSLPDRVVSQVASKYGPGGQGGVGSTGRADDSVKERMPSDASGGTVWEDWLR
jgi:hypothetical protein